MSGVERDVAYDALRKHRLGRPFMGQAPLATASRERLLTGLTVLKLLNEVVCSTFGAVSGQIVPMKARLRRQLFHLSDRLRHLPLRRRCGALVERFLRQPPPGVKTGGVSLPAQPAIATVHAPASSGAAFLDSPPSPSG